MIFKIFQRPPSNLIIMEGRTEGPGPALNHRNKFNFSRGFLVSMSNRFEKLQLLAKSIRFYGFSQIHTPFAGFCSKVDENAKTW